MKIVVVGSQGTLGRELAKSWNDPRVNRRVAENLGANEDTRKDEIIPLGLPDFDDCSRLIAVDTIVGFRPDVVVNASGVNLIDWLESRPNTARTIHEHGPANIREAARRTGALFVQFGCGEIFYRSRLEPGVKDARERETTPERARLAVEHFADPASLDWPIDPNAEGFDETTIPNPASVYAKTKLESERVAAEAPKSLILRFSSLFGETTEYSSGNLVASLLKAFCRARRVSAINDCVMEPLWAVDVLCALKTLLRVEARGLVHLAAGSRATPEDVARELLEASGLRGREIVGVPMKEYGVSAPHSVFTLLKSQRAQEWSDVYRIPDWRRAVRDFLDWRQAQF